MSRKLKKLFLKHSFLSLELDEVNELCSQSTSSMRDYISEHYPDEYKLIFKDKNTNGKKELQKQDIEEKDPEDLGTLEEPKKDNRDPELRNIYKKIIEKTHPDKIGSNLHSDIFSKATKAYKENNAAELVFAALSVNIKVDLLSDKILPEINQEVLNLEKQIHEKTASFAWLWHLSKTEEEKEKIAKKLIDTLKNS